MISQESARALRDTLPPYIHVMSNQVTHNHNGLHYFVGLNILELSVIEIVFFALNWRHKTPIVNHYGIMEIFYGVCEYFALNMCTKLHVCIMQKTS